MCISYHHDPPVDAAAELGRNSVIIIIIIIINDTLARSLEPVVTECKEHTIHTQTHVVASRNPKDSNAHTKARQT